MPARQALATSAAALVVMLAASSPAVAQTDVDRDNASCMGLGSSFYGQFAPQQRAFVAAFVNDLDGTPGEYYVNFATEKEGGAIAAPCGTRLE